MGKRLIGRYEVTSIEFFPGFKIIMIWAVLSGRGQDYSLSMALNMYIRVLFVLLLVVGAVLRQ
jgi:hypothetical protein